MQHLSSTLRIKEDPLANTTTTETTTASASNTTNTTTSTSNSTASSSEPTDDELRALFSMTAADDKCYEERFKDLNGTKALKHFKDIGQAEHRHNTCAKNLSDFEAISYLMEYPDLQQKFGIDFTSLSTLD